MAVTVRVDTGHPGIYPGQQRLPISLSSSHTTNYGSKIITQLISRPCDLILGASGTRSKYSYRVESPTFYSTEDTK